jgi:putative component of membrane protein insertase Oxa1/YidC/SpoIIIJ protein YidD
MKEHLKYRGWLFHVPSSMKNKLNQRFILIFLFLPVLVFAQPEKERWGKAEDPYLQKYIFEERNYGINMVSVSSAIASSAMNLYWFFISDQDGDNCPFYPSCSHFFIESVKQTDLIRGSLMFADRFTRDMNIFNRRIKYPFIRNNRLYDPPELYKMTDTKYPPQMQ